MQFPHPTLTREFLSGFEEIWRLWVPLLLLLIWMGWATRRWWGGRLLLLSLVVLAGFAVKVILKERAIERATMDAWNKLRVPLSQAAKIDGLQLAAGTIVRWNPEREGHLLTAELGAGQEVSPGMVLVGEVDRYTDEFWRGTLAKTSVLRGWTCAAGKVDIHVSGELRWCVLAGSQKVPAGVLPAGTAISFDGGDPSYVMVHLANIGMHAAPGNFWIEPDGWFVLYEDGELFGVSGPITRRGVTFEGGVELRYGDEDVTRWYYGDNVATQPPILVRPSGSMTGWRGDINAPLTCEGGHIIEIRSRVTVPVSGNVVTTTHWDSSKPKAKPILDSFPCALSP
jgi:hypothetical protein